MSFLPTRGLGQINLATSGLGGSLGTVFVTGTAGSLFLSGVVLTSFIAAPVSDLPTNAYGRRFLGSFLGPSGKGHS